MLRDEMRDELLRAALGRETVTYGHLMKKFGLPRGDTGETVVGVLGVSPPSWCARTRAFPEGASSAGRIFPRA